MIPCTRQKTMRLLESFGEAAVPGVRKRLEQPVSLEVRQRATAFLRRFEPSKLSPARLLRMRAVELLEAIGTPAAKSALHELARGPAGVPSR
jgi:hypothetical protein